ncbi:T9SS type A sorting domain-containing protein [Hymenobacter sp. BT186]|uniref:T9SS type A sorting domain-containing protein n=1 Tax=Hymenobacter telluris TaxID=2816474 RepID=A0A939EZE6_9BACT|nr:T9SS type A sorting domain-containing protein [Hymenobacter telluris]MBO0359422.1 T9SS type A sorting domain-containing protein [Hymenobacter telluris]MBW3375448.1 T9SS type A sorting domain-containing protein [Hymenobacter norwichensis]
MNATFYSPTSWLSTRLRSRLATLAAGLLLAPAAWAQIEVPAGNPTGTGSTLARKPLATYYGYERSAMIYTAAEIGTSGSITNVGFYVNSVSTPGAAPTKIYLKTVANATFAAATTVAAEETGATLVYDSTIPAASFTANTWVSVPLTTPFAYNGTSNLEVIVETNATGAGNEGSAAKAFRYSATGNNRTQFWQADNAAPTTAGALSVYRPNIQLTGLTALTCPPVTALTVGTITTTTAQLTFTGGTGNTGYTVIYTSAAGVSTTVTPAPTASPVALTGLTPGTTYSVTVAGNCTGSTTSQAVSTGFSTLAVPPANDDCATATALTVGTTCTPVTTTNVGASASTGVPAPSSTTGTGCFVANTPVSNDVWYSMVVPASGNVTVTTSAVTGSPLNDTGLVLYTGTCGSLTEVACSDDATATSFFSSATATGLTPGATIYARVWSFGTTPTGQFGICAAVPAPDAAVQAIYALGTVSTTYASPVAVQAVITNTGALPVANLPVTLTVTGATTFTDVKLVPTLAAGASATVTFATFPVTAASGTNTLTVTIPADGLASNNSRTFSQTITPATLSYTSGTTFETGGVGVAATNSVVAIRYQTSGPASVRSVTPSFAAASAGGSYQIQIYSAGATAPGTLLYTSPTQTRTTAASSPTITLPGVNVNGPFYVGILNLGTTNLAIAYQLENPLRPGTFLYTSTGGTTWVDISTSTLNSRLAVDVALGAPLSNKDAIGAGTLSVFPNPAHQDFTLRLPAIAGQRTAQLTLINTLGQQVQSRTIQLSAAGTDTQMDVSNLAKGIYTLRVQTADQVATKQISVE